jgi:hypothetical protein
MLRNLKHPEENLQKQKEIKYPLVGVLKSTLFLAYNSPGSLNTSSAATNDFIAAKFLIFRVVEKNAYGTLEAL